jgi:hypothetical protein
MTILATVPQRSEIPEGLMNYPVQSGKSYVGVSCMLGDGSSEKLLENESQ